MADLPAAPPPARDETRAGQQHERQPQAPAAATRQHREAQRQTEQRSLRHAIEAQPQRPAIGKATNGRDTPAPAPNLGKAIQRTIGGTTGALGKLAGGFSLDGLTPKEKHETAKLRHKNEREAEDGFDANAWIIQQAKALEQEQQREEEHRQRQQRDRERYEPG